MPFRWPRKTTLYLAAAISTIHDKAVGNEEDERIAPPKPLKSNGIGMRKLTPDEMWRRHANRWSVYTRFAAIPAAIVAGWSRVWLDWWAAVPLGVVVLWLIVNPFIFKPINTPTHWIEKGILGEQLWLRRSEAAGPYKWSLRVLLFLGFGGLAGMIAGIIALNPWLAIGGALVVIVAQIVRIRRFADVYNLCVTRSP